MDKQIKKITMTEIEKLAEELYDKEISPYIIYDEDNRKRIIATIAKAAANTVDVDNRRWVKGNEKEPPLGWFIGKYDYREEVITDRLYYDGIKIRGSLGDALSKKSIKWLDESNESAIVESEEKIFDEFLNNYFKEARALALSEDEPYLTGKPYVIELYKRLKEKGFTVIKEQTKEVSTNPLK